MSQQLESEITLGKGKLDLQASLTLLIKNFKHTGFLSLPYICHSSVLYNHTHANPNRRSLVGEKWKTSQQRKKQNPGLREICHTHYAHHRNTHTKKRRAYCHSSMSQFGAAAAAAAALLNERWQVHVRYVDVHYQLREVIHGERYAAVTN